MKLSPGQVVQRRYRIVRLLGQGGFGAVYRAWDMQMEGPCALKQNLAPASETGEQFAREARMLFKLRHPSLPRVIDYFVEPGLGEFLVMDFIEGQDLKSMVLAKKSPLAEDLVVDWIVQVCEALSYMHTQKPAIIHRDIKPANIKVAYSVTRQNGLAVLVDFGIAKAFDPETKTTKGARAVTSGFSPLEQYGLGITDHQSDIYSLGATAYYLLTAQQPVSSLNISMGVSKPNTPIHLVNARISIHISQAIEAAMQIERHNRTRSAEEFRQNLLLNQEAPKPRFQNPSLAKNAVPHKIPDRKKSQSPTDNSKIKVASIAAPAVAKPYSPKPVTKGLPKWFPCLLGVAIIGILITIIGIILIRLYYW